MPGDDTASGEISRMKMKIRRHVPDAQRALCIAVVRMVKARSRKTLRMLFVPPAPLLLLLNDTRCALEIHRENQAGVCGGMLWRNSQSATVTLLGSGEFPGTHE